MLLLVAVPTDRIIIEAGIFDESHPLTPPRRNVAAVVLVEVLPEESCEKPRHKPSNTKTIITVYFLLLTRLEVSFVFLQVQKKRQLLRAQFLNAAILMIYKSALLFKVCLHCPSVFSSFFVCFKPNYNTPTKSWENSQPV